jgi:hypothetical protein
VTRNALWPITVPAAPCCRRADGAGQIDIAASVALDGVDRRLVGKLKDRTDTTGKSCGGENEYGESAPQNRHGFLLSQCHKTWRRETADLMLSIALTMLN